MATGGLNWLTEAVLIWLLGKVKQPYSARFFKALTRLLPVLGFEAVILREREGRLEVLLNLRSGDTTNPSWNGLWHCPGTVLRVDDTDIEQVYTRLASKEVNCPFATLAFVGFQLVIRPGGERRSNAQLIYLATLPEGCDSAKGHWFSVDQLPPCIGTHPEMVADAAAKWRESR